MSDIALKITSDSSQARSDLAKLTSSVGNIEKTTSSATKNLVALASSVTAAFAAFSAVSAINKASDSFTNLENKIALVVGRTKELIKVQDQLVAVSIRTRGSIQTSAEIFNKFGSSMQKAGVSTSQLITATENVQKAIAISGAEAESARAAIIQLGQGLSSGTLRGEELNSVLEQTPRIAKAIADGIGVSIGELKGLAEEGRLTSATVFNALISQTEDLNKEFALLAPTFGQATGRLEESVTRLFSQISKSTGFTSLIAKALFDVSMRIESIADVTDVYIAIAGSKFRELVGDITMVGTAVGGLAKVLGQHIARTVPVIRTFTAPLTAIANSFLFDAIRKSFDDFYKSMFTARQEVRGLVEALGFFVVFGDTRVSRTIGDIFRSDSVVELTKNINKLTAGLDPTRLFNFLDIRISLRDKFVRPFYEGIAVVKSFGAAVGLVNNPLIEFSNIRFDRFVEAGIKTLDMFVYTLEAIVYPAVVKLSTFVAEFTLNSIEYIRNFLGLGPSFLTVIERATKRIGAALGIYAASAAYIDSLAGALTGALTIFQSIPEGIITAYNVASKYFALLIATVVDKAKGLDKAEAIVKSFVQRVKEFFYDAWDKVVGHSYWPDLVEGVINWAKKLNDTALKYITSFTSSVEKSFSSLHEKVTKLSFTKFADSLEVIKDAISKSSLSKLIDSFSKLISTGFGKVKDFVITAKVKLQDFDFGDLIGNIDTEQLITNIRRLVTAVVLATIFAIASPAKFGIIFSAALISLEAALAQKVTAGLYSAFNLDFFREIGDTLGTVVGMYFAKALEQLPDIMRNIVTFADAFGHAFLEQFGLIGKAISSFINVFSFGDTGILGFLMFGVGATMVVKNIESIRTVVDNLASFINGTLGGKGKEGGLLGQALLGPNVKYLVAGIATIIAGFSDQMSLLAATATATPLLATAIFGEDVTGKLIKDTLGKILGYFIKESLAAASVLSKTKLAIAIFGEPKAEEIAAKVSKTKKMVSEAIKNINNAESRKDYLEGKISFFDLLFGKQEDSATRKAAEEKLKKAEETIKNAAGKFGDKIKQTFNNQNIIDKVVSGAGGDPSVQVGEQLNKIKDKFADFTAKTSAMAGAEGLIGKIVGNKGAIVAGLIAALTLFSTQAKAAETEVTTVTDNIVSSITSFLGEYGIYAFLVPPQGWAYLFKVMRSTVTLITGSMTAIKVAVATTNATVAAASGIFSTLLPGLASISVVAKLAWTSIVALGNILLATMGIATYAIGFAVAAMYRLLTATLAFLATPVGLLLTGVTVGAGLLVTYFFGEGDTFSKKLDSVIRKTGKLLSGKSDKQKELEGILPTTNVGETAIDYKRQLSNINYDKLSESQFKSIKAASERTADLIKRAKEEEEDFGRVTAETAAELSKFQKLLNDKFDKFSFGSTINDLSSSLEQAKKQSNDLFTGFNKDITRQVKFFNMPNNFSQFVDDFMLPFDQILNRFTVFNDSDARDTNKIIEDTSVALNAASKYLKPDEINAATSAINRMSTAMGELGGFNAILEKIFPASFSSQRDELDKAGKSLITLRNELVKTAETREKVKQFNDGLTAMQTGLKKLKIDINFEDLYTLDQADKETIADRLIPDTEQLKKNLSENVYDATKALEIQQQIDANIRYINLIFDKSKLRANFSKDLEAGLKQSSINLDLNQFVKNVDKEKFKQAEGAITGLREIIATAELDISKAKSVDELADATQRLTNASRLLLGVYESSLGSKTAQLASKLAQAGISVSTQVLDAIGEKSFNNVDRLTEKLNQKRRDAEDLSMPFAQRTKAAREMFALERQIKEAADYTARNFSETFSFVLGKTNLSFDVMNALKLSPAQGKEASKIILESLDLKRQLEALPQNAAGLAIDQTKAQALSSKIAKNQDALDELAKTFSQRLTDRLQKAGSKVDLSDILNLDAKDVTAIDDLNKKIIDLEKEKDKIGRTGKTLFGQDLEELKRISKDLDDIKKKRDALTSRDIYSKIEGLASKANVSFTKDTIGTIDENALESLTLYSEDLDKLLEKRKKFNVTKGAGFTLFNQQEFNDNEKAIRNLSNLIEDKLIGEIPALLKRTSVQFEFKDLVRLDTSSMESLRNSLNQIAAQELRINQIREQSRNRDITAAEREEVDKLILSNDRLRKGVENLKTPQTFGDLFTKIQGDFGLTQEQMMTLDLSKLQELAKLVKSIKTTQEEIADTRLSEGRIDEAKLKKLQDELRIQKAIAEEVARRTQLSESFLSSTNDAIKSLFSGEKWKDVSKSLGKSIGTILSDNLASQLNSLLFKTLSKSLGNIFGGDLFSIFKGAGAKVGGLFGGSSDGASNQEGIIASITSLGSTFMTLLGPIGTGIASMFGTIAAWFGFDQLFATTDAMTTQLFQTAVIGYLTVISSMLGMIFARISLDNPAFASGGVISGPGTGKSDSILAKVSNGEFIVNAAATKKFLPLLHSINNGAMPKFADGGLVPFATNLTVADTGVISVPANSSSSGNQQVFNIQITGDISKQTKSEIYRMLPSIAAGVNQVNRENNYKR